MPELSNSHSGITLVNVGVFSYHIEAGDGFLIYSPNSDFSECYCFAACEVVATYPDLGQITVDLRTINQTVMPDKRVRHIWRDRPYLCLDVSRVKKYGLLNVFVNAFNDPSWKNRRLRDAKNLVFSPDLSKPTLQPRQGNIYILKSSELYKIGKSVETDARKRQIERDVREPLTIIHQFASNDYTRAELTLHAKYAPLRKHGEWFNLTEKEVSEIMKIKEMNF